MADFRPKPLAGSFKWGFFADGYWLAGIFRFGKPRHRPVIFVSHNGPAETRSRSQFHFTLTRKPTMSTTTDL
ncbi:MAG: hypothetical protein ACREXG_07035, partial [Polaromonas sp.]